MLYSKTFGLSVEGTKVLRFEITCPMSTEQVKCRAKPRFDFKAQALDFPGGAVVKDLPTSAGDMGLSPGPGRSHMPWSN